MTVPVDSGKYGRPSLVSPEALAAHGLESGAYAQVPPPRAAILLYHRGLAQRLLAGREATKVPGFFGDTWLLAETDGEVAIVADFGIGAPVAAVMLEDLVALGCRTVVSVGTCGGMDPALSVGDVVLVERAVRDEGTSHHYLPAGEPVRADEALAATVEQAARARGLEPRRGATWTTDAPYRETAEEVRAHLADGVGVVEMEAAALFAVAAVKGAQVASLLVVSDVLEAGAASEADGPGAGGDAGAGAWTPEFHGDLLGERLAMAVEAAIDALR